MPNKIIPFERHGGGDACLCALAFDALSDQDRNDIIRICNQPAVKQYVTYRFLVNDQYTIDQYQIWLLQSKEGWGDNNYTYIIRDANNGLVGSVALRQEKIGDSAEWVIGYWADQQPAGRGYVTNAVIALLAQARQQGVARVSAYAELDNVKSQNVMQRIGMSHVRNIEYMGSIKALYTINL
jgi:RimJ/RimL family protein N-acetyltransferase